ncbi:MAG: hypothetical protein MI861_06405 [Pirellulales bacterium]|nr:hypothetical protein [Pirellulales bacterium]
MTSEEKIKQIEEFLLSQGDHYDAEEAREIAEEAVQEGVPLVETICLHTLAEHVLAPIHDSTWVDARGQAPDTEEEEVIKRLLDSGASAEDLAIFARIMQREYLSNLGCILDGAGIYGTPKLPYESFRIFCVDDDDQPQIMIDDLHESLGFVDLETEQEISQLSDPGSSDQA